ncbi:hypothetical protein Tco_0403362 [Tanacetum coccineum]
MVDQFPTPGEIVRVESLPDDQLTAKISVLHCMMMSHGGELLARYLVALEKQVSGLNDKLTSSDASFAKPKAKGKERKKKIKSLAERDEEILRLKTTPSEFSSFFRGQFQGLVRKFLASDEFSRVQRELLSLATSDGFECGLSMHRTKDEFVAVLKKMVNFMPGAHDRLVEASPLVRPDNVPIPRGTRVSPPITKELTVTPVSESLELSANVNFTAFAIAFEHNKEMVNAEVDRSDPKMTDD